MNYEQLYYPLFNACTDAITQIDEQNYGMARRILMEAQQKAEQQFMEQESEE